MILDRLSELEMVVLIFELIINVTLSVPLCLYVSHYVIISLKKSQTRKFFCGTIMVQKKGELSANKII